MHVLVLTSCSSGLLQFYFQKWYTNAKRGRIAQLSPPLLGWSLLPFLAISICIESNVHNPKRERIMCLFQEYLLMYLPGAWKNMVGRSFIPSFIQNNVVFQCHPLIPFPSPGSPTSHLILIAQIGISGLFHISVPVGIWGSSSRSRLLDLAPTNHAAKNPRVSNIQI